MKKIHLEDIFDEYDDVDDDMEKLIFAMRNRNKYRQMKDWRDNHEQDEPIIRRKRNVRQYHSLEY